jgi:predicted nucleotidyltransferase
MDQLPIEKQLREITDKIVDKFQPEKIILFGSWAWGKPHEDSDVDLLIVKETKKKRWEREYELRRKIFPAGLPLDLLIYTPAELEEKITQDRNLFLEDIIKNGVIVYARDQVR